MNILSKLTPTKWDEVDYGEIRDGTKTTKATVEYALSGELEGSAHVEYLMFYSAFDPADMHSSEASFIGLVTVDGTLAGRRGSFIVQESGTFSGGVVSSTLVILQNSGSGEFKGISGHGIAQAGSSGAEWGLTIQI